MTVIFDLAASCEDCGMDWPGIMVRTVRILKGSLRSSGKSPGIGGFAARCPSCNGNRIYPYHRYLGLSEASEQEVNEWRARKGWPPIIKPHDVEVAA